MVITKVKLLELKKELKWESKKQQITIALKLRQQCAAIENIVAVTGLSVTAVEHLIGIEQ
ncbi:MAG: hypothetical protein ACOYMG_01925 [Candidatus Methylumidiphilus sp.]